MSTQLQVHADKDDHIWFEAKNFESSFSVENNFQTVELGVRDKAKVQIFIRNEQREEMVEALRQLADAIASKSEIDADQAHQLHLNV